MNNGLLYVRAELRQKYFETPGYKNSQTFIKQTTISIKTCAITGYF